MAGATAPAELVSIVKTERLRNEPFSCANALASKFLEREGRGGRMLSAPRAQSPPETTNEPTATTESDEPSGCKRGVTPAAVPPRVSPAWLCKFFKQLNGRRSLAIGQRAVMQIFQTIERPTLVGYWPARGYANFLPTFERVASGADWLSETRNYANFSTV
uniref:Uncharacterized protein n=1 Tax=Trichuris muris TaxID=70415 RepID=A0A5S6QDC4_TRIMR